MKKVEKTDKSKINWKIVRGFIGFHQQFEGISAADIEYSLNVNPEIQKAASKAMNEIRPETEEEKALRKKIAECNDPSGLVDLMRKPMPLTIRTELRCKLIENEDSVAELIKAKCMRNSFDIFIENAVNFFIKSKRNYSDWIVENYFLFHNEYMRAMLCLVLGFRGEVELIPFLMDEAERFEDNYPDELYERGPVLAVQELYYRFKSK